jgi:hypothetical protein
MRVAAATDQFPEPNAPHRAFGSGRVIRDGSYGHVEVTAVPLADSSDLGVDWQVRGASIPADQREAVVSACLRTLEAAAAKHQLRCGVALIVEYGSYHEASRSAHPEAAEIAVRDALRRGRFTREV